jgi:hypothetical protein
VGEGRVQNEARKPVHHRPSFWIGLILCLAAIAVYLWSDDLSWLPGAAGASR